MRLPLFASLCSLLLFSASALAAKGEPKFTCLSDEIHTRPQGNAMILIIEGPEAPSPFITIIRVDTTRGFPAKFLSLTEYPRTAFSRSVFGNDVYTSVSEDGEKIFSLSVKPGAPGTERPGVFRSPFFNREKLVCSDG